MTETNTYSDIELFRLIAEGDERAFEMLFHGYVPKLHPLINKVTGSETAIKDIIQEVFLYLWIGRENLVTIEQPQNWIFKIAYNRCYSWLASKTAQQRATTKLAAVKNDDRDPSLEEEMGVREMAKLIRSAIQELPEQAKKIFILSRESGMKAADIADHLGITVQTVRNSLSRSGKSIKEQLEKQGIILPLALIYWLT